jgi:hypothetical protein
MDIENTFDDIYENEKNIYLRGINVYFISLFFFFFKKKN